MLPACFRAPLILARQAVVALLMAAGCIASPAAAQTEKFPVVATFSILADLVHQVGGDAVEVTSLVGPGADTHVYSPTPADAKTLAGAKLVFVNGLGLEGWMERLISSSGTKAPVIVATRGITPIEMDAEHDEKDAKAKASAHKHVTDPHAWQNVANAKLYVANIRDALTAADSANASKYAANAEAYLSKLDALQMEVKSAVDRIPVKNRRIITSHDAFGYFGKAYGFAFIAPQGVSTETEASAKDVARIIRQIRAEKIPAVFLENVTDPRLIKRIAAESGAKVGEAVFSDALSDEKGPAPTYIDMIRHNIRAFGAALAS